MPEQIFLDEDEIKVTNARFITKGRTYAVNGITSVSLYEVKPRRAGVIVCAIIALIALSQGYNGVLVGVIFIGLAVVGWFMNPQTYSVRLMTASGESDAFTTKDHSRSGFKSV
ncbi:MAG: hypothetical protein H0U23_15580 [Blastocatellia bacterium]|jgi:hypothetical protein|nr:hypothetical protein [Blastocatellia bacterium]